MFPTGVKHVKLLVFGILKAEYWARDLTERVSVHMTRMSICAALVQQGGA